MVTGVTGASYIPGFSRLPQEQAVDCGTSWLTAGTVPTKRASTSGQGTESATRYARAMQIKQTDSRIQQHSKEKLHRRLRSTCAC